MYLIQETARLSGVSVRTLHHYDKIGLLKPHKNTNGYRYYEDKDLDRLQEILFYKYLGFPLREIKNLLENGRANQLERLEEQLRLLKLEQEKLAILIQTLTQTIQHQNGELKMTASEKFTGFSYQDHEKYKSQAIDKYGQEVIATAYAKQAGQEDLMVESFNRIFQQLAVHQKQGLRPQDPQNMNIVEELHQLIRTYAFDCSLEVFGYIGQGYVANPEFTANIDQFGQGVAQYTCDAIQTYISAKN